MFFITSSRQCPCSAAADEPGSDPRQAAHQVVLGEEDRRRESSCAERGAEGEQERAEKVSDNKFYHSKSVIRNILFLIKSECDVNTPPPQHIDLAAKVKKL